MTAIADAIGQGMQQMGITPANSAVEPLAAYLDLLERWNRRFNLSAVRRPEDMVVRHVLDSLAVLPWLQGPRILDVGSGAGLPGIPLAVVSPRWTFHLLDSNGKRVRFLRQAVLELKLANIQVVQARVEDYRPAERFDSVLARAFATLAEFVTAAGRLCAPQGRMLAFKGRHPDAELQALPAGWRTAGVYPLAVPGLDAARHLVHLVPDAPTTWEDD